MSDESFVLIGTPFPLPNPSATGVATKNKPFKDLEARDEQGRQRFHGAFTGGFSAGYYNTVGSKEGWAPSQFVSSRSKRADQRTARPEDFMDDEDRELMAESSRLVARDDFDTFGSTQRELERKRAVAQDMQASGSVLGVLPDSLIDDLVVPVSESIGIRLLKQMGWKPGQGIGPRVTKKPKKQSGSIAMTDEDESPVGGAYGPGREGEVTFAPQDSALITFDHKSDLHGLGFDPYRNAPEFNKNRGGDDGESRYLLNDDNENDFGVSASGFRSKKKAFQLEGMSIKKSYDDDDNDEIDVYGELSQQYSLYEQDSDEDTISMRGRQQRSPNRYKTYRQERQKTVPTMAMASAYGSDGRPVLQGFILAPHGALTFKWFPPPVVPRDFVPFHKFHEPPPPRSLTLPGAQPALTADDRALVLGDDAKINAPARSVFEYLSKDSKSHLDNVLGFVLDVTGERPPDPDSFKVPNIEKEAAEAALKGFIPFGDNPPKQARYKQYLQVQAGILADEAIIQKPQGMSGEDMTKEFNEFVQAARIFRPLSGTMASRFTTASKAVEFAQPAAGLRSASDVAASEAEKPMLKPVVERMEIPKSQAAKAAAMGMFGPLTRTTVDFYPSKLLCKRFNVPNPHPDHKQTDPEAVKDLLDSKTMDNLLMNRGTAPPESIRIEDRNRSSEADVRRGDNSFADAKNTKDGIKDIQAEDEPIKEEQLERPPMDLFKAIFDDSDSDTESESEAAMPSKAPVAAVTRPSPSVSTTTIAATPPSNTTVPQEASSAENMPESTPLDFRPVFVKRADRGQDGPVSLESATAKRPKLDIAAASADEEDDEDFVGPKLTLPYTQSTRTSVSTLKKTKNIPSSSSSHKNEDSANPSKSHSSNVHSRSDHDRKNEKDPGYSRSSSSGSRRDRDETNLNDDRRRDRKSSKRHREDRDRDRHRDREHHRDRDRHRDREHDRDRDRDRDKKRHRSDRDRDRSMDKEKEQDSRRSGSSRSKRRERDHSEEEDMGGMWVEKTPPPLPSVVGVASGPTAASMSVSHLPAPSSSASTPATTNTSTVRSRPRAADFF